jgi:Icc-related predicted phosphoesterase
VKLLAFSDLHTDLAQAEQLVELAAAADVVLGAGDFASQHERLRPTIAALAAIAKPAVLVPGNNETDEALRAAVAAEWPSATVLHGEGAELEGRSFFGLGAGVPVTPWDWSFDLSEEAAAEMLSGCPQGAILVLHSPPRGHCDRDGSGNELGSEAILAAIERTAPTLAVCGHIHDSWGERATVGPTEVANLGPRGAFFDL